MNIKIIAISIAAALISGAAFGQTIPVDSSSVQQRLRRDTQGQATIATGKAMMATGAITAVLGGSMMFLGYEAMKALPQDDYGTGHEEAMGPLLLYLLGAYSVVGGGLIAIAGIPVTVAGHSMASCPDPWLDARYNGLSQKGPGIILEGGFSLPGSLKTRLTGGYHFNQHVFLGAGMAPTYNIGSYIEDEFRFNLPVYADARFSIGSGLVAPYGGLSVGYDVLDPFIYLSTEAGLRVRMTQQGTRSLWSGLIFEVSGSYMTLGLKLGYSF